MQRLTRNIIIAATALAALSAVLPAAVLAQDEVPHHPANLSLFYPISTNQDPTVLTYLRLNLMYGRVGYINGVDIGTIVNRTDRNMRGIQLTGIYSHTGADMRGASATLGVSYVGGSARGLQLSGLVNFDRSWFRGVQYATLFNFVQDDILGLQVASLFNLGNADFKGIQLASFANLTAGDLKGAQVGGLNYVNDFMRGAQIGVFNFAVEYRGAQIGAINLARKADGLMVGIVNYTRELKGVPVGAVNWDDTNGNADWSIYATSSALINTGLRTVVNGYVSTLSVGTVDIVDERDDTLFLTWYYGYLFPVGDSEKWWLSPQVGYVHIMPQSQETDMNNNLHFSIQALVTAEVRITKTTRVFFGGGVDVRFSEYSTSATNDSDPLFLAGVALW